MTSDWSGEAISEAAPPELLKSLGVGALGETFLARHAVSNERIAITRFHDAVVAESVFAEFEAHTLPRLVAFRRPGVMPISPFFRIEGRPVFAMPFYAGENIQRYRGRPITEILDATGPMLDALADGHAEGFVHGGLRPSNLHCDAEGRIQIAGLGLGELVYTIDPARAHRIQTSGSELSPALRDGRTTPVVADDLFAIGALLYEWISGRPPPSVETARPQVLPPIRQPGLGEDGSRELLVLIARLRQGDPDARPQSIESVQADLAEIRERLTAQAPAARNHSISSPPARGPVATPPFEGNPSSLASGEASLPTSAPAPSHNARGPWIALGAFSLLGAVLLLWLEFREPAIDANTPDASLVEGVEAPLDPAVAPAPPEPPTEAQAPTSFEAERKLAELKPLYQDLNERTERLTQRGAEKWAPEKWTRLRTELTEMKAAIDARTPEAAEIAKEQSLASLLDLESQADTLLATSLREGTAALDQNALELSVGHFETALLLDDQNKHAASGLLRARKRPEVLEKIARALEEATPPGKLSSAIQLAREASQIDPRYTPANDLLNKLERRRAGQRRSAALAGHQKRALEFEAKEAWREAQTEYEAALALSSGGGRTAQFAPAGLARSATRHALDQDFEALRKTEGALFSRSGREQATRVLSEGKDVANPGPRLREQIQFVERALALATTPVAVRLLSDSETEVTIYHVGRQGRFERKSLELLPGTYTIVGSRNGYRDVRRSLEVKPTSPAQPTPLSFTIRCEEAL